MVHHEPLVVNLPGPVLLLSGRKRSGKDTFAARLVEAHGFTRVAFADPIREMVLALDPFVGWLGGRGVRVSELVEEYGWEEAKADDEVRRLLQRLGTEAGRDIIDKNLWTRLARKRIEGIDGPVVVTDVRFPNELTFLGTVVRDVYTVRIERPGLPEGDLHPSETALDGHEGFDVVITNDGTVDDLHKIADTLARGLLLARRHATVEIVASKGAAA